MVTIEHLEVQFDVAGEGDEKVFAEYFARFIKQWNHLQKQETRLQDRLRRDQKIGDDDSSGGAEC